MVTDFGIAVPAEALAAGTGAGVEEVVGTAEFMSPEQARGSEVDARSDLYSLGCVAFHTLAGRVPFTGPTPAAVLGRHLSQPPPPLLSVAPHVPAAVAAAVDRCPRKEPDRRFSSAEVLAEALGPQGEVDRELPVPLRSETPTDRILQLLKAVGYAGAALTLPAAIITDAGMWLFSIFSWSFLSALTAGVAQEIRARGRGDVIGERWLRLWKGWAGKGIFRLAGVGLQREVPAGSRAHRPTELALGLAADRLYEELPKDTRKSLRGLPDTVRALEEDAQAMRGQVAELDAVLAEVGDDDPSRPGAGERARVRAAVEATRDEASEKLHQAVKALETIRLGLLMMHAPDA